MKRILLAKLAASLMLALTMAFLQSCGKHGCDNDADGKVKIGSSVEYDVCRQLPEKDNRCTGLSIWESYANYPYIGDCYCHAKGCKEDESLRKQ
ncbi:MAG: hypothetical protein FWC26_12440 [Fibromonadales bacterium]|nr:hypothetical protein [Fibromonadales bacterium]